MTEKQNYKHGTKNTKAVTKNTRHNREPKAETHETTGINRGGNQEHMEQEPPGVLAENSLSHLSSLKLINQK